MRSMRFVLDASFSSGTLMSIGSMYCKVEYIQWFEYLTELV